MLQQGVCLLKKDIRITKISRKSIPQRDLTNEGVYKAQKYLEEFYKNPGVYNEPIGAINQQTLTMSQEFPIKYGLRTGDSLLLATAVAEHVDYLATCDDDF